MKHYTIPDTTRNADITDRGETHTDRWARRISRDSGISFLHAQTVLQANGVMREARDD